MSKETILVADDDMSICMVVSKALEREGFEVKTTNNATNLWNWVHNGEGDVVITDVMMPDANIFDLLPRLKQLRETLPIIVMSAKNTFTTAITAMECGAYEYLPKPFDLEKLVTTVKQALKTLKTPSKQTERTQLEHEFPLVGRSTIMQNIYRSLSKVMKNNMNIMLFGESGTGKNLIARILHDFSLRHEASFVTMNIGAIPTDFIKQSFVGSKNTTGCLEKAEGGTIFLKEVTDIPVNLQAWLLQVLEEKKYKKQEEEKYSVLDVRVIASSSQDIKLLIEQGLFRKDLYYHLNVMPIQLPPLRYRLEDLADLCEYFFCSSIPEGEPIKKISLQGIEFLKQYHWPGNIRELKNLISRLTLLYNEEIFDIDILRFELQGIVDSESMINKVDLGVQSLSESLEYYMIRYFSKYQKEYPPVGLYDRFLQEVEYPLIKQTLVLTKGNQIKAAEILGLNRNTLRKKIRYLNIIPKDKKS